MKTYSFLDSIKKQEKEVMLCACPRQKILAWQGQLPQRPFTSGGGRQAVMQLSALFFR